MTMTMTMMWRCVDKLLYCEREGGPDFSVQPAIIEVNDAMRGQIEIPQAGGECKLDPKTCAYCKRFHELDGILDAITLLHNRKAADSAEEPAAETGKKPAINKGVGKTSGRK